MVYLSKFDLMRLPNKGAGWSSDCTSQIRFDETYQFAAGSANVSITRFAECSKNSEGRLASDIDR